MMWKPTKAGTYRLGGREIAVRCDGDGLCHEQSTNPELFGTPVKIHDHATWSILAPEWQPGAPTVAQLERWQWWAIWGGSGQMMVAGMVAELRLDYVLRSAPIQPDLTNGPMWVPLEVVK